MLEKLKTILRVIDRWTFGLFMLPVYRPLRFVAVWANKAETDTQNFLRTSVMVPIFGAYLFIVFFTIDYLFGLPRLFS